MTSEMAATLNDAADSPKDGQCFGCENCLKYFSESDRAKRCFYRHIAKPFKCDLCVATFINKKHLKDHMRTHTGEQFLCDWCGSTFGRKSNLRCHKCTHTGEQPSAMTMFKVSALQ